MERERRDIVTGESGAGGGPDSFCRGPDRQVVPDLARKLPGRGIWVRADRASIETASKKGLFARAAKAPLKAAPDLAELVERLLAKRCLEQLGLARREGVYLGVRESDGRPEVGQGGVADRGLRRRLGRPPQAAVPGRPFLQPADVCGAFSSEELGLATGQENVIHTVLLAGRRAERWTEEVRKLAGFCPLLPESWREEARTG